MNDCTFISLKGKMQFHYVKIVNRYHIQDMFLLLLGGGGEGGGGCTCKTRKQAMIFFSFN